MFSCINIQALSFLLLTNVSLAQAFLPGSFSAEFEEHLKSKSNKVSKSLGQLDYKFPSRIKVVKPEPENIIFVSNPKKTFYYTGPFIEGEPGELKISDSKNYPMARFFDVLMNGLKSNNNYKVLTSKKDPLLIKLVFEQKFVRSVGIKAAKLHFNKSINFKNIKTIEIEYQKKSPITYTFKKIVKNKKFSKQHFVFTPPKNTKILER